MKNLLACIRGAMGVPLAYVIRVLLIPEDKDNDPPFGEEDTKYTTADMETTACALILSDDANDEQDYDVLKSHGPFVPSFLTDTKKFGPFSLHVLATQAHGNTSRKLLSNRMGAKLSVLFTIVYLGGTRLILWSLTYLQPSIACAPVVTARISILTSIALPMWSSTIAMLPLPSVVERMFETRGLLFVATQRS